MPQLFIHRLQWAKTNLAPVRSRYRIGYDDPWNIDAPVTILAPDPNWMAAALHGGILPPVECYHQMKIGLAVQFPGEEPIKIGLRGIAVGDALEAALRGGAKYIGQEVIFHELHIAEPLGPMTEEQALEYQAKAWLPRRVRDYRGNRQIWRFIRVNRIPTDRTDRKFWSLSDVAA